MDESISADNSISRATDGRITEEPKVSDTVWYIVFGIVGGCVLVFLAMLEVSFYMTKIMIRGWLYIGGISALFGIWQDSWWAAAFMMSILFFIEKTIPSGHCSFSGANHQNLTLGSRCVDVGRSRRAASNRRSS